MRGPITVSELVFARTTLAGSRTWGAAWARWPREVPMSGGGSGI